MDDPLFEIVNSNSIDLSLLELDYGVYEIAVQTVAFNGYLEDSEKVSITYRYSFLPEYYDDIDLSLLGEELLLDLRELITETHTYIEKYDDLKIDLQYTDEDLDNLDNIILFYSQVSIDSTWDANYWNREHVWPQSLGWFTESGAGADLHHLRPTDPRVNSTRNNRLFGEVENGTPIYLSQVNGNIDSGCYYSGNYFEPRDEVKGDVARIIFYLFTRYPQADNYEFNDIAQSLELLLAWNELDPVSHEEMVRNNRIAEEQGNRNPFIDYPEFAEMIWG